MKLIDYKCEKCERVVDDWEYTSDEQETIDGEQMWPECCGAKMTPIKWMNNKLPTCGEKGH